ncbi:hypothetical protein [Rhodoferax aquaticus]|uniref:Uncharacterized protein n=1 Tax=Rhodoferax aquaticus TaxID=2527691 RepID=A0A515ERL7_9BURK|nr:hypothetical protein [Rhodoferax aquaticus]QDL55299.1 hypothetical protein EXZ61_14610 [Rhodoferax aquaticus]
MIYSWPNLNKFEPSLWEWSLQSNTQAFSSPLSGSVQTLEMPGARWRVAFQMNAMSAADSALLRSFLAKLRGQSGRFYLHNMAQPTPRGAAGGTPVVNGAAQTGASLATSGWPASSTVLKEGDFFAVNGELKMATADALSTAGGLATLTFEPPLRSSPGNGLAITTTKPLATFRLEDDSARWSTVAGALSSFAISAIEAW